MCGKQHGLYSQALFIQRSPLSLSVKDFISDADVTRPGGAGRRGGGSGSRWFPQILNFCFFC